MVEKNIILKFSFNFGKRLNLSTSPGEIIDQIKKVESYEKKCENEKQTKDH